MAHVDKDLVMPDDVVHTHKKVCLDTENKLGNDTTQNVRIDIHLWDWIHRQKNALKLVGETGTIIRKMLIAYG